MKRLILIRHAKSSWDYPMLADFDRPLNPRGRRDAPIMAQRLQSLLSPPFRIIASPAMRALTTAQLFAETFEIAEAQILIEPRIYDATPGTLLHLINTLDDRNDQVLMFGHNPGFTDVARVLVDGPLPFIELPTCGVLMLGFEEDRWQDIVPGSGEVLDFRYPKEIPG
ncbi:MAG: histidine phosphatase family protein [Nevskia sp.]|nr:histidine phosphatase family protein [Nevskia sp.]